MTVYFLNLALIYVWGVLFLGPFGHFKKGKLWFIGLSFGQMFLLLWARYRVGFDYDMYAKGFVLMSRSGFSTLQYLDWEPGFVAFTKLIGLFTNSIPFYMGIIAAFCLASWGIFFYRYSRNVWISTILFVNLYFLYLNMNFLRQSIAVSIALFAWTFLKNRRFLPFLGLTLLASLFHTTALILLPVYLLVKLRPGMGQLLFYSYALLFFYISSEGILNLLTMVFHEEYANSVFLQGMSFFYALMPLVLLALLFLFQKQMLASHEENRYLIGLVLFGVFCMVMMSRHAILERLSYYAFGYVTLAIPALLDALKIPRPGAGRRFAPAEGEQQVDLVYSPQAWTVLVTVLAVTTLYHVMGLLENVHGVVPYLSRFFS